MRRRERVRDEEKEGFYPSKLTWVIGVDVGGLDGDETRGVGRSRTETLSKKL